MPTENLAQPARLGELNFGDSLKEEPRVVGLEVKCLVV
jgi:hypothetical protein